MSKLSPHRIGPGTRMLKYIQSRLPCCIGTVVALLLLTSCGDSASPDTAARDRSFRVIAVNDVYNIEGVYAETRGGLARVRSLRKQLNDVQEQTLLLLAGDFLFPSPLSDYFAGSQMVELMNILDGDVDAFDGRFYVTFGNHEFDRGRLAQADLLAERIEQSDFTWLGSNVDLHAEATRPGTEYSRSLKRNDILRINGVKVGLFSLTTDKRIPEYADINSDYIGVARSQTAELRGRGAEVIIALTHLSRTEDVEVLSVLGDAGPDVIFGGHEHERQSDCVGHRCVLKADSEARSATAARITVSAAGEVRVAHRFVILDDSTVVADPVANQISERHIDQYESEYCGDDSGCLRRAIGHTAVDLIAEELEMRRYETNFGAFVADQMIAAFDDIALPAGRKVQVALNNAGGIRLNQNIPAGTEIDQWYMDAMFPYRIELRLIEITGRQLRAAVNHAIEGWPGKGWWLHSSGIAFRHDTQSHRVSDLSVADGDGWRRVQDDDRMLSAVSGYLVNTDGDQDGYTMLSLDTEVAYPGELLVLGEVVADVIREKHARNEAIAPKLPGRVCSSDRPGPCVLDND